jgi:hypothetical protein
MFFLAPRAGAKKTGKHLNLIGNDSSRAELCADLVCAYRIEIDNAKRCDESVCLEVLQISQGGHIILIRVVLPIELGRGGKKRSPKAVKNRQTCKKSRWVVRMRVMRSRTAASTVERESSSPCLNMHHLVPPRTVRGGRCS